nr:hypothetical protein [Tanacetum cinerariifolium]
MYNLTYIKEIEAKNELLKAYEQCRDISMDKRAKIKFFLKIESELDYEMQSALFRNVSKLEKQIRDKLVREVLQSNYVCVVPDAYAFRPLPQVLLSFQLHDAKLHDANGVATPVSRKRYDLIEYRMLLVGAILCSTYKSTGKTLAEIGVGNIKRW